MFVHGESEESPDGCSLERGKGWMEGLRGT